MGGLFQRQGFSGGSLAAMAGVVMRAFTWLMDRGAHAARWCVSRAAGGILAAALSLSMTGAWAGLSVYTSWSSLPPTSSANQRTIDFSTNTLASEKAAGKLDFTPAAGTSSGWLTSAGSISYNSSSSLTGFSGNVLSLTSGTTNNATSLTITFATPTPYVGFLWGVEFNAENSMQVNITLEDGTVVTLNNCSNTSNNLCVAKYVASNWFTNVYNALLGWLLGDSVTYYPIYMQYEPDGVVKKKITKMQVLVKNCAGCGFLSSNSSQDLKIDYITYVDASVKPHHLEVTSSASSTMVNAATNFTVTACGDAACSVKYTSGVSGNLTIAGVTATSTSIPFTIDPGPANSTTVSATMTSAGTATIGLSAMTPVPSAAQAVYCGMGTAASAAGSCNLTVAPAAPHHMELTTNTDATLSCEPVTFTIKACADANCTAPYTSGVSGTLGLGGSAVAFNIPNNSSQVSQVIYSGSSGTVAASLGSFSVAPSNTPKQVYCGIKTAASASGSCNISVTSSGFVVTVPDHFAEDSQSMTVEALTASSNPQVCTSVFGPGAVKDVVFKCGYTNPTSGTRPVRIGNSALNASGNAAAACDGTGKAVSLTFKTVGSKVAATTTFQYADVGNVQLLASYTGGASEPGLLMSGSKNVIVAPASFGFSGITPGPIKAGSQFGATVTARNRLGNVTPNFGKEQTAATADLTFTRRAPTGTGAVDGTFTGTLGAFSPDAANSGMASSTNLVWTEVGTGDLVATLKGGNYLLSGVALVTTGSTGVAGSVGPFIPDRFKVDAVNACTGFSFNEQPFTVNVTALNVGGAETLNQGLSGTLTPDVTLELSSVSPAVTGGVFSNGTVSGTSFAAGKGSNAFVKYKFDKLSPPTTIGLKASATFGGVSVVSQAADYGSMTLRSGRLKISNVFGSEKSSLDMQVQSQFWSANKIWVLNALDSCTTLPASAVALTGYRNNKGQPIASGWTTTATPQGTPAGKLSAGKGLIRFSAPNPLSTGSVDVALNLGDPNLPDASCLATHGGTGAGMPWLRSQNGNCAASFDRDPSARVTFGIFSTPETKKTIHVREIF